MRKRQEGFIRGKTSGLVAVFLLMAVIISPWVMWHFKPAKKMEVSILDKTVPQGNYREHKGLVWLLNNKKFVKEDGNPYSLKDYYGFFPGKNHTYDIKPLPKDINNSDLIYVADTYGVYRRDFYGTTKNLEGERSQKIYGGTTSEEVDAITRAVNDTTKPNKTLVVEFNTLASPTESVIKGKLDTVLGVEWTGWIGRQFSNLNINNEEIPRWVFRNYEKQYNKKWEFKGRGYVLVKDDDTIVVLEKKDLGKKDFWLEFTSAGKDMFNVTSDIGYYYWFDIVKEKPGTTNLANFHFDLNYEGTDKFKKYGIPHTFPAIALNKQSNYTSYYFAGDFADKNNFPVFYQAAGLPKINGFLTPNYDNQDSFFWKVYTPIMEKIFDDVSKNKEKGIAQASSK